LTAREYWEMYDAEQDEKYNNRYWS
jgi:hypothetical protein